MHSPYLEFDQIIETDVTHTSLSITKPRDKLVSKLRVHVILQYWCRIQQEKEWRN